MYEGWWMVDATRGQSTIRRPLGDLPATEALLVKVAKFMRAALMAMALLPALVADVGAVQFGLPSAVVPSGLGLETPWNNAIPSSTMDLFAASGVGIQRTDMKWSDIELSPDSYTFGVYPYWGYDDVNGEFSERGIRNLFILDSGNSMYGGDATTSAWQTGFTNYAKAVAAHYAGSGNIYEIYNEPMNQANGLQNASVYTGSPSRSIRA